MANFNREFENTLVADLNLGDDGDLGLVLKTPGSAHLLDRVLRTVSSLGRRTFFQFAVEFIHRKSCSGAEFNSLAGLMLKSREWIFELLYYWDNSKSPRRIESNGAEKLYTQISGLGQFKEFDWQLNQGILKIREEEFQVRNIDELSLFLGKLCQRRQ